MTQHNITPPKRGFTPAWVESKAPLPEQGYIEVTDPKSSIRLRCYASGKKVWVGYIRSQSKNGSGRTHPKAKVLGPAIGQEALTVSEARQKHGELLGLAKSVSESTVRRTVSDLYLEYSPQAKWADKALKTANSFYNKWLKDSDLGKLALVDVTTPDVWRFLKGMSNAGLRTHHNKGKSILNKMFKYAISAGYCKHNPTRELNLDDLNIVIEPRDRALDINDLEEFDESTPELIEFWQKVEQSGGRDYMNIGYKILLSIGCRPSELWGARWDEFSIGEDGYPTGRWVIPANRIKNENKAMGQGKKGKDCVVILCDLTLTLLERLRVITGSGEYLFPLRSGEGYVDHNEFSHALAAKFKTVTRARKPKRDNITVFGMASFTPHDLRRSLRTYLSVPELGVAPHVAEAVLGHQVKFSATHKVYDRYSLTQERGEALQAFGNYLAEKGLTGE